MKLQTKFQKQDFLLSQKDGYMTLSDDKKTHFGDLVACRGQKAKKWRKVR